MFLRSYYRCVDKFTQGCLATKQVQRSSTDPNMLVITYISEHNHPRPIQSMAPARSTRSFSSSICSALTTSVSSTFSQNRDAPNKSHLPSPSTFPRNAAAVNKEEDVEECQNNMEFDTDIEDTRTLELFPDFQLQHQPEEDPWSIYDGYYSD